MRHRTTTTTLGVVLLLLVTAVAWQPAAAQIVFADSTSDPDPGVESAGTCPVSCGHVAEQWCRQTFQDPGGIVTVGECGVGNSFQCVCNGALAIDVTVSTDGDVALCTWPAHSFEPLPRGERCGPQTGVCPASVAEVDRRDCRSHVTAATDVANSAYTFSCATCAGRFLTVARAADATCTRTYSAPLIGCEPAATCGGNGCCTPPPADGGAFAVCTCFRDDTQGFWDGPRCDRCAPDYDPSRHCRRPPNFQTVLSSIARTWTMLSPNLAVLVLFVLLGFARQPWDSDRSFALTALRRANLSPVQTARRGQPSLFRSKYIPRRPVRSRCFLNEDPRRHEVGVIPRGPPAY